jgi:hypothetical protein
MCRFSTSKVYPKRQAFAKDRSDISVPVNDKANETILIPNSMEFLCGDALTSELAEHGLLHNAGNMLRWGVVSYVEVSACNETRDCRSCD